MHTLICLFFPSMISLAINNEKKKLEIRQLIEKYCIYNIVINIIVLFTVNYMHRPEVLYIDCSLFTVSFTLKYLAMASIIACIVPGFEKVIRKIWKDIKEYCKKNIKIKVTRKRK